MIEFLSPNLNQSDLNQMDLLDQEQSFLSKSQMDQQIKEQSLDYYNQVNVKVNNNQQQKQKQGDLDTSLQNISVLMNNMDEDNIKNYQTSTNYQNLLSSSAKKSSFIQDSVYESTLIRVIDNKSNNERRCKSQQNQQQFESSSIKIKKSKPNSLISNISLQVNQIGSETKRRANLLQIQSEQIPCDNLWQRKWMQIIYYISKFRKIAREFAIFYRPHMLKKIQVQLIADQGSSLQYQSSLYHIGQFKLGRQFSFQNFSKYMTFRNYRKMIKCVMKYLGWLFYFLQKIYEIYWLVVQLLFQYIPLFHYLSYPYIMWETIIYICSTILFIYIPFEYSFKVERIYFFSVYFQIICPIVYGIDIFIRANTKSTETGHLVENHIKIFNKYFKTEMIPDILSVLCLNYRLFDSQATYFFFFIRVTKSFRILDILREQFLLRMKISGIISLLFLAAQAIYFSHLICCVWNAVGVYESKFNEGWIVKYDTLNSPTQVRYLRSFYYSVITMTTIGYGDYTPCTDLEKLTVILIAFISCGVFGYSINSIGSILYDFKQKKNVYLQGLAMINKYFKQYDVDLELQARARKYLDYIYTDKKNDLLCSIEQLSNLTEYLRDEIKGNVYTKRLKNIKIFTELFTEETLTRVALKMREKILSHDQDIIHITSQTEPTLCIVHSGTVAQYVYNENNKQVKEIKEGQFFGLENFLQETYYSDFNYKSHGICCVLQIQLSDFLEEIKKNSEEYEKFCFLRDELKFKKIFQKAGLNCDSCAQKNHSLRSCPFIFYEGKKEIILRRYFQRINKQINSFERKNKLKKFRSLIGQQNVERDAKRFINEITHNQTLSDNSSNYDDQEQDDDYEDDIDQQEMDNCFQKSKSYLNQKSLKSQKSLTSTQHKLSMINSESLPYTHVTSRQDRNSVIIQNHSATQQLTKMLSLQEEFGQQQNDIEPSIIRHSKNPKKTVFICEEKNENEYIENNNQKRESHTERNSLQHFNNQFYKERHSQSIINPSQIDLNNKQMQIILNIFIELNMFLQLKRGKIKFFRQYFIGLTQFSFKKQLFFKLNFIFYSNSKQITNDFIFSQIQHMFEQIMKKQRKSTIKWNDRGQISALLKRQIELNSNTEKSYYPALSLAWDQQLFFYDIDLIKVYNFYYPNQNYLQIVEQQNKFDISIHQINQFRRQIQKQLGSSSCKGRERCSSFFHQKNTNKQ